MVKRCANPACAFGIGGRGRMCSTMRSARSDRKGSAAAAVYGTECSDEVFSDDWLYRHIVGDKPRCSDLR
jgi:hypothetical protein